VSLRRLRAGEWLAGAGTVALLALLLFADWFRAEGTAADADPSLSGAAALGWPLVLLLLALAALAAWLVIATAAGATTAQLMVAAVVTVVVGAIALLVALVRVLAAQPGLGARLSNAEVGVAVAGYLGLVAVAAILAGAWRAMADERTDAPESAFTPPPARPAPPPET
jgi:hypothetical protein